MYPSNYIPKEQTKPSNTADHSPMRILHVIDKLSMDGVNPSSCAILLAEWISHLYPHGFNGTVCTLRRYDPGAEIIAKRDIKVHHLEFGKYSLRNVSALKNLIDKERANIVHLHGYSAANFGRIAARAKGVVNVVHEHAVLRILPHQYIADLLLRHFTDAAIAVSQNVRDFMIRGRNIPANKIEIIWNGINLDKFRRSGPTTVQIKREELGIPGGFRVIGTVTRLREEKGNKYLIRAMPEVIKEFPNVIFLIVGDGPLRSRLEELTRDLNLLSHVKFLGFRSDVAEILSVFDVNVISSLSEGFPLSLVEAMSVGNAIVASEVGGMKEVGKNGETVLFVPPKNPTELSNKINFLLRNSDIAAKLSNLSEKASQEFRIEKNASLLSEFYMKLKPL